MALDAREWLGASTDYFILGEECPGNHWIGGWVDLRACETVKYPQSSSLYVAVPTELPGSHNLL